jgi:hypothetical protein
MLTYAILLIIALSLGIIDFPNLHADSYSTYSSKDGPADDIGTNSSGKYYDIENLQFYNSAIKTAHTSDVISNSRIHTIQIQSNTTDQDTASMGSLSNTNISESLNEKNSKGIGSSDSSDNNNSPTDTTDQNKGSTTKSNIVKCEGSALCVMGEVVKVINGKTLYVNIDGRVYKVELALISLPIQYEQAMRASTMFTRNTCLGSTVLIDQDDKQKENSFIAQVYCSPTKNLNSLLLDTDYVLLDKSQCGISEFSNLNWAKSHGC